VTAPPRKVDVRRGRLRITERLEDFPRQHEALQNAMEEFGPDFDLRQFKNAYESKTDLAAYNRAQAVERGLARIQNYVAEVAIDGCKLGELTIVHKNGEATNAFATLAEAGVISRALASRLQRAQRARSSIEHTYVRVPAGSVHRATVLIFESSREFIGPFRDWIEPYFTD
jgi:uncharacterized protein YutE (UPF0331/DUF86 family)